MQVLLACVIVPLWLLVVRQLVRQEHPGQAAAAAVAGLVLLLTADAVHRSAAVEKQAAARAVVTAASIPHLMGKVVIDKLSALRLEQLSCCSISTNDSRKPAPL